MLEDAIVKPLKGKNAPDPGRLAVLVSTRADMRALCRHLDIHPAQGRRLFTSRIFAATVDTIPFSIVGPMVGAPYAVMLLETLAAWGVRRFIFWGWAGAVGVNVQIGDVIVPTAAVIDEGTSQHYDDSGSPSSEPSESASAAIRYVLARHGVDHLAGAVWSTDAIFRETPRKIRDHQHRGVLAVDMELSALFTVAACLAVELGGILVVSDELSTLRWRPGFKDPRFLQARRAVCRCIADMIAWTARSEVIE